MVLHLPSGRILPEHLGLPCPAEAKQVELPAFNHTPPFNQSSPPSVCFSHYRSTQLCAQKVLLLIYKVLRATAVGTEEPPGCF